MALPTLENSLTSIVHKGITFTTFDSDGRTAVVHIAEHTVLGVKEYFGKIKTFYNRLQALNNQLTTSSNIYASIEPFIPIPADQATPTLQLSVPSWRFRLNKTQGTRLVHLDEIVDVCEWVVHPPGQAFQGVETISMV